MAMVSERWNLGNWSQSLKNIEQIFRPEKASSGRVAGPLSQTAPPQCDFTKKHDWPRFPSACVRGCVQVARAARRATSPLGLQADGYNVVGGEGCHKIVAWLGAVGSGDTRRGEFSGMVDFCSFFSFSS